MTKKLATLPRRYSMTPLSLRRGAHSKILRRRGQPPPEETNAEHYFLLKQLSRRNRIVVTLTDGETVSGIIDWYDQGTLRLVCDDGRSLILPKQSIRYLFREEEGKERRMGRKSRRTSDMHGD